MFSIDNRNISRKNCPYIVAELSANHNGSLLRAKQSIQSAKECGADAIKIQSYTPDTMTIKSDKSDFIVKEGIWKGYTLYDLYNEAHTPYEWHSELFEFAKQIGITIFSSPFDETAVDLLEDLNTPAYKIASYELCDLPLIKYVARTKKPILMSTGMASACEIDDAVHEAQNNGCEQLLLFHCISSYPAPIEHSNLSNITFIKQKYGVEVGLSDHTIGNLASTTSIALGATAIEKHFTLSREDKGPDSQFSIEPDELKSLVKDINQTWLSLGDSGFSRSVIEETSKNYRRSIYFVKPLKAGEQINSSNIRRIRPGHGLPPKFYDQILGKTVVKNVEKGDPVTWQDLE